MLPNGVIVYNDPHKFQKARNSPQQGHLSPTSRLNLKVNPEFFNNAPKHKGDIEIFTKSPPRDFPIDTESLTKPPAPNVPQVQIFTSPDRTFKYTITQPADDFQEEYIIRLFF